MRKEIENKKLDNDETIRQIKDDSEFEMNDITSKNTQNQKQVQEMSLRSKAELQLTMTKLGDLSTDIDTLKRLLQDEDKRLADKKKDAEKLRT